MSDQNHDVIVIGAGPGGEGAAMKAVKEGQSVAVVEKYHLVGGGCTHWGAIPSKALRHSINRMLEFNTSPIFRNALGAALKLSYPAPPCSAESVSARQTTLRRNFHERNRARLHPEISSISRTERELTEARVPYEVGRAYFKSLARAQITGRTVGILKLLFHRETLEILGIHCFGDQAAEIVHIGQAIMAQRGEANTIQYFVNTTFNYPTMAEAYRVAALNGLNRLA